MDKQSFVVLRKSTTFCVNMGGVANFMVIRAFIILSFFFGTFVCNGQKILRFNESDSICIYGKKYDEPKRLDINFPFKKVSNDYKKNELHRAIPDSFNNEDDWERPQRWWLYHYYFGLNHLLDYDPKADRIVHLPKEPLYYILNDTYFFDINGDGLLDFIHYPKYYMALMRDFDVYEIFIQQKSGTYKIISFKGFITEIEFNQDSTLNKMTTYEGPCCDDNQCTFYYYTFNKEVSDLTITKAETIFTCQLKKSENIGRKKIRHSH
jgi:hypothetical protein